MSTSTSKDLVLIENYIAFNAVHLTVSLENKWIIGSTSVRKHRNAVVFDLWQNGFCINKNSIPGFAGEMGEMSL